MSAPCLRVLIVILAASCTGLDTSDAFACSQTSQDVFTVGNKATDSSCTYDTIAEAIGAATCPAGTTIVITPERSYMGQHLTITNQKISLVGRGTAPKCNSLQAVCGTIIPCPTEPLITIYGGSDSLIQVRGASTVLVKYLTLIGADNASNGGAIDFQGSGTLTIDTSTLEVNTAASGGGIYFKASSASDLIVNHNTQILANTATSPTGGGGGIYLEGPVTMTMTVPQILVTGDVADRGYGGGIEVLGAAQANIGSPGFNGSAAVSGNHALHGGGIAVLSGGFVHVSTSDPAQAVGIEGNQAIEDGGGAYLDGASVLATNYHIDNNTAVDGSAIFATGSGSVELENSACSAGECNTISSNKNRDNNNVVADGSTITKKGGVYFSFSADGLHMRSNDGSHLMDLEGSSTVENTLLVDNHATKQLLYNAYGTGPQGANWLRCTVAHNTIDNSQFGPWPVFAFDGYLGVFDSIIGQPNHRAVAPAAGGLDFSASTILANDIDGLTSGTPIQADPAFVDEDHGDFHLLAERANGIAYYSPAIDMVYASAGYDVDHRPRSQDIAGIGGSAVDHVTQDLGAYEMQPFADRPFSDGFGDTVLLAY